MDQEAINRIQRYVAAGCPVRTETILSDAHVFWWDTADGEDAAFAIINRNGNFARAFQGNGVWHLAKNLGRAGQCFSPEEWEWISITDPDLRVCAQKMWLPARNDERLTFLPKELTPPKSRRLMICRDQLFEMRGGAAGFSLKLGDVQSPTFTGTPWESVAAVNWCIARCNDSDAPKSAEAVLAHAQMQQAVGSMEELDCFGMF